MDEQKTGGQTAREFRQGEEWSKEEKHFHINVLELLALKSVTLTFTKNLSHLTIRFYVAMAYLLKMGGTRSPQVLNISKSIWNYLLSRQITITVLYSKQVECQSRLGAQECNGFIRLETSSESFSENNQTLRNPSSRSICL